MVSMKKNLLLLFWIVIPVACHMEAPLAPQARFEVKQEGVGLVTFTNKSNNATSFTWDFGDNKTETTNNDVTSHKYATSGNYVVKLLAKGEGGSAGTTQTITVNLSDAAKPPVASFEFTASNGQEAPSDVKFTNSSTGNISSYQWKVNNSSIATSRDVEYTFQTAGTYKVSLQVTGSGGTDTREVDIVIKSKASVAPVASFTVAGSGAVAKVTAVFTNTSSNADTFLWNFDDGKTSTEKSPSHDFSSPGVYNIILVANGPGGTHTYSGEVVVLAPARVTEKYDGNRIASSVTKLIYNGSDNLVSYRADGSNNDYVNTQVNTFDGQKITKVTYKSTEKSGNVTDGTVDYEYNELGLLKREVRNFRRPNNRYETGDRGITTYEYGANHIISKITADSTVYTYSAAGVLTGISFIGNGTASRTFIDGVWYSGQPVVRDGKIVSYAYTDGSYRTIVYDSNGQKQIDTFTDPGRNKKITENFSYDNRVNPAAMDSKFKGHPTYAQFGRSSNVNNISGHSRVVQGTTSATPSFSHSYSFEYNAKNLPTLIKKNADDQDDKKTFTYILR
jgi:YD repeat-containing protein